MTRALAVAALALALAGSAGCSHSCRPGSIFADLVFDGPSSAATSLVVQVAVDGKTLTATTARSAGPSSGSLEIDLPGHYAQGKQVLVTVTALDATQTAIGRGSAMPTLADSCSTIRVPIESTSIVVRPPDMAGYGAAFPVAEQAKNKVDVVFMIDNSLSMDVPQKQLNTDIAAFIAPFTALAKAGIPTDVHLGVVTSDYGAGDLMSIGCQASPGGQKGFLQGVGTAAAAGCVAPTGSPFVSYTFDAAGDHANLAVAATPDALAAQIGCMTSVGAMGCGFEHQLESLYAGLHNTVENAGFLRADALLTVILLTNEDDGSAPPTAKFYESTADTTVYGAYDTYRQTRFAVGCGGAPLPYPAASATVVAQTWMHCAGLPNPSADPSLAYDVGRYIDLFTQPLAQGGVKTSPDDVIMVAIDAPETPFTTLPVQRDTGAGQPPNPTYKDCGPMLSSTCVLRLQHSCQNMAMPTFFGDPAVRISSVVSAAHGQSFNICGDDASAAPSYVKALTAAGQTTAAHVVGNCVTQKLADPAHPDCQVTQTIGSDVTYLPSCAVGSPPCWTITSVPGCTPVSPDGVALRITRSAAPPAGATVTAWCKTQ
jgi:hypothetical protein